MYSARIEDLALRAWAIGARWQLKTQALSYLAMLRISQGYNWLRVAVLSRLVVVPYYLSQGYNTKTIKERTRLVVVPYYLSQGIILPFF